MRLQEPYRTRPVRFLELWTGDGWRMKVYGIRHGHGSPSSELVEAALDRAAELLPRPAESDGRYGVGFIGVHEGRGSNFVFVDWWADENELHHHVYVSDPGRPGELEYRAPDGSVACVWDLAVLCFERQAWIESVLADPDPGGLERYLERRMNRDV